MRNNKLTYCAYRSNESIWASVWRISASETTDRLDFGENQTKRLFERLVTGAKTELRLHRPSGRLRSVEVCRANDRNPVTGIFSWRRLPPSTTSVVISPPLSLSAYLSASQTFFPVVLNSCFQLYSNVNNRLKGRKGMPSPVFVLVLKFIRLELHSWLLYCWFVCRFGDISIGRRKKAFPLKQYLTNLSSTDIKERFVLVLLGTWCLKFNLRLTLEISKSSSSLQLQHLTIPHCSTQQNLF